MLSIYGSGENISKIISVNVCLPDCCLMNETAADVEYDVVRELSQRVWACFLSASATYSGIV